MNPKHEGKRKGPKAKGGKLGGRSGWAGKDLGEVLEALGQFSEVQLTKIFLPKSPACSSLRRIVLA